jgi:hypothetical protein
MNSLETLKERLKIKPVVQSTEGVRIVLATTEEKKEKAPTKIIANKDDGRQAQIMLERLKKHRQTIVREKFPTEEKQSQSVIIEEAPRVKVKKPIKKKEILIIEEEPERVEILPEGGPMMEEPGLELDVEDLDIEVIPVIPRKRISKKVPKGVVQLGTDEMIQIGDTPLPKRLPPLPKYDIKASSYYMNNREIFINFINGMFETYKDDLLDESKGISCEDIGKDTGNIGLLTHQKIVRDYINLYTPYRGLLLYHGLGSGKTCSSIAIAEGLKNSKKVIVMTPASLRRNYLSEIKKCGDLLYRRNQYWEWISTDDNPEALSTLSSVLGLSVDYIRRKHGAWLVNMSKPSNFTELTATDKRSLDEQLDEMIQNKYTFINYNGIRRDKFRQLTNNYETNIFDNSVVIIDEVHNLISRIVGKLNSTHKFSEKPRGPGATLQPSLAMQIYEFLLRAENCRIVLLSGTPIINYPNEIAILYNILRGYIKTWTLTLNFEGVSKINTDTLRQMFAREKILDYMDYLPSSKELTITRNPFGFESKITSSGYKGVTNEKKEKMDERGQMVLDDRGVISDDDFIRRIVKILKKNDINVLERGTTFKVNTALPDTLDTFISNFVDQDTGALLNVEKFKRRIIGLTSYFRSAQEELMPRYNKDFDFHVVHVPMSDYQFGIYENARIDERKTENRPKKQPVVDVSGLIKESSSTYKVFSRLYCNFVMPKPPGRPIPKEFFTPNAFINTFEEELEKDDKVLFNQYKQNKNMFVKKISDFLKEMHDRIYQQSKGYDPVEFQSFLKHNLELFLRDPDIDVSMKTYVEYIDKPGKKTLENLENPILAPIPVLQKTEKERLKEEKERRKAEAKEEKERLKSEEKAEKERLKAEEKAEKERIKADAKAEKERLKQEEKERKRQEKLKKGGAGDDKDDDEDQDQDEDDDNIDDDDNTVPIEDKEVAVGKNDTRAEDFMKKIQSSNLKFRDEKLDSDFGLSELPTFMEKINEDEEITIPEYRDEDANLREADELEGDEVMEMAGDEDYKAAITNAYNFIKKYKSKYLVPNKLLTYSPKFLAILENIIDPEHKGLHLVYSQFRTMEGIGIFSLVLEANGFSRFKIKKTSTDTWDLNMSEEDLGKPTYALYTGTEEPEEKEIIRNIYNGDWENIPNNIASKLRSISSNNNMGEIVKVFMITAAGSEGINLRNTRYVHAMEPYWHPVRVEQVVGRARRICSHQSLPLELQTVEVFIYLMTLTQTQLDSDYARELRVKDLSKRSPYVPLTSDECLFEISTIKQDLSSQILKAIKESSIDCATHVKSSSKEGLVCLSFGQPNPNAFSYNPNYVQDENDTVAAINRVTIDWEGRDFIYKKTGKKYVLRNDTHQVYDYDSVMQAKQIPGTVPILIGKLVKNNEGVWEIVKERL